METLPPNTLIEIALHLPINEVEHICSTNHILDISLCQNEDFWQNRYLKDFGQPEQIPLVWKEAYYRNMYSKVYFFEDNNVLNTGIKNIQKVSAGSEHYLFLDYFGYVYSYGSNDFGQLGMEIYSMKMSKMSYLRQISNLNSIQDISAGGYHSLVLTKSGEVYSFGYNEYGQLGLGNNSNKHVPTLIPNLPKIVSISAGSNFSLILSEDGQLYGFGHNRTGELGLGDREHRKVPTKILDGISSMSTGKTHSLAIDTNEHVYVFGQQNGISDIEDETVPFQIQGIPKARAVSAGAVSLILTEGGHVIIFGKHINPYQYHSLFSSLSRPPRMLKLSNIIAISAGEEYSLILNGKGYVTMIKNSDLGEDQIQLIKNVQNVLDISVGDQSLILTGRLTPYSTIEMMNHNGWIQSYHPKYPKGDNWVFEFVDIRGDTYLSEV